MKVYQQYWKFRSGKNKGFIFMLDVAIGLILAITIVAIASYYINKASEPILSKAEIVKRGPDIILLLHERGALDSLDSNIILENMTDKIEGLVPFGYDMRVNLTGATFPSMEVGTVIPEKTFIGSGKMFFALTNKNRNIIQDYYLVRYWLWTK